MRNKLLFCNIGWMENYCGITDTDKIINGGKYIIENQTGGEIYNFQDYKGYCYGYVQPVNNSENVSDGRINITKLGASETDASIDGIDVVLTAKRPKGKTVIIGYYKNATVYREKQINPNSNLLDIQNHPYGFRFKSKKSDVKLLSIDERNITVPRAGGTHGIKGGFGQSPVWFAQNLDDKEFFKTVNDLLEGKKPVRKAPPDNLMKKIIEVRAVEVATAYYLDKGYLIESVEKENRGWDLEAKLNDVTLLLEIKGLSSREIYAGITPNEYKAMQNNKINQDYRLCIVSNCVGTFPTLSVFSLNVPSQKWIDQTGKELLIQEKIAAIVTTT